MTSKLNATREAYNAEQAEAWKTLFNQQRSTKTMSETTTEKTYKWSHPQEWLQDYINGLSYLELQQEARNLASLLDGDAIQDNYQSDMDAQGYFTPEGEESEDDDE